MLETINLQKSLSKSAYEKALPELKQRLRNLQYSAYGAKIATVICLEGWDGAGKREVARKLSDCLDPRIFRVVVGTPPTAEDLRYHFLHRYQLKLPAYGEITLFERGWYQRVLEDRAEKRIKKTEWRDAYRQIADFERWLTDDGQLVLKFWMHISKKRQKQRFKKYLDDPAQRWIVTSDYRRQHRDYTQWLTIIEEMLANTESPHAPWTIVESDDLRWASVRIMEVIAQQIERELQRRHVDVQASSIPSKPKKATKRGPRLAGSGAAEPVHA